MSIAEATKNMLDVMPEADVKVIYLLTRNLFEKGSSPFRSLTRAPILNDLEVSRKQIEEGDYLDFDDAMSEIEAEYDL